MTPAPALSLGKKGGQGEGVRICFWHKYTVYCVSSVLCCYCCCWTRYWHWHSPVLYSLFIGLPPNLTGDPARLHAACWRVWPRLFNNMQVQARDQPKAGTRLRKRPRTIFSSFSLPLHFPHHCIDPSLRYTDRAIMPHLHAVPIIIIYCMDRQRAR